MASFSQLSRRLNKAAPVSRISIVVATQVVCAAVGLWLHGAYIDASAQWSATEDAYAELDQLAGRFMFELSPSSPDEFPDERNQAIRELVEPTLNGTRNGFALLSGANSLVMSPPGTSINGRLTWQPKRSYGEASRAAQRGLLRTSDGDHPAMSWEMAGGQLRGVVFRRQQDIVPGTQTLRSVMPAAAAIAFVWIAGLQSVIVYLMLSKVHTESSQRVAESKSLALQRAEELVRTQDAIIFGLAKLAESRDSDTGLHLERISLYATHLTRALRNHPRYADKTRGSFMRLIGISSALHDVGKVGVEDSILNKPGPLTPDERSRMQQHTLIGAKCLSEIEKRLGSSNFLHMAREISLHHHEHWDGNGYPHGLRGDQIPLAARIVAIADVYDALSTERCYKDAFPHEFCVNEIRSLSGSQFDPALVEVFLSLEGDFRAIARSYHEKSPARKSDSGRNSMEANATETDENNIEQQVGAGFSEILQDHPENSLTTV